MAVTLTVLLTVTLSVVTMLGDQLVAMSHNDWTRALADNATHGVIGLLTWLIVSLGLNQSNVDRFWSVVICGLLSSLIDVDHFLAAHSIHLKAVLELTSRPFLHCTSVPLFLCCLMLVASRSVLLHRCTWLVVAALVSHHTRDAARRGFWMWPFGSTPPLPHCVYIACIALLPHALLVLMRWSEPQTLHKSMSLV